MPPKRNGNKTTSVLFWSKPMDDAIVDAYLHEDTIGNRVGGTFTPRAFENIIKELREKFSDCPIDKEKVQNRMKHIKRVWTSYYDIFRNGLSGFNWDPISEMLIVEPEVWQQLIEVYSSSSTLNYIIIFVI